MNLSAPTQIVFLISMIIALLALIVALNIFTFGVSAVWLALVAYAVLAGACLMKGV